MAETDKIRRKSRSIEYAGTEVRNHFRKFQTREQQKSVREAYSNYWDEHNSKLRDDLYFVQKDLCQLSLRQRIK